MKKGKKISGGKYVKRRKKKSYERAGQKRAIKLGEEKRKIKNSRGKNKKIFLIMVKYINVKTKSESKKVEIKNVLETPANRFLARQNVLVKGALIETEVGKARITNRPSQEGNVNGILIE